MRQKLTKLCKRLIDFAKDVTLIEILSTVCIIAMIICIATVPNKKSTGVCRCFLVNCFPD